MAPTSPKVKTWNRRVLSWGCAPLLITGLVAGFVPALSERLTVVGTALVLLIGIPVTGYTWWLRRDNSRRYDAAVAEAEERGMRVRVVETEEGDHEYVLDEIEDIGELPTDRS